MTKYEAFLCRKNAGYGSEFDPSNLAPQFVETFNTGKRVEVEFVSSTGEVYNTKRGTIGVTGGWCPVFLLMLTKRSIGSSHTLGKLDRIVKVIR